MTDHPITPPPELMQQWHDQWKLNQISINEIQQLAAQWGADQELEACCEWVDSQCDEVIGNALRADRRPKPPSLAEVALAELNLTADNNGAEISFTQVELIRRALERLQELEGER